MEIKDREPIQRVLGHQAVIAMACVAAKKIGHE
jgi:hypothetical protein